MRVAQLVISGHVAGGQLVATLEYPAAEWGVPTPEGQLAAVRDAVQKPGMDLWGVVGLARTEFHRSLAAARAALLLTLPMNPAPSDELKLPPTYVAKHEDGDEAILLILRFALQ